GPDRGDRGRDPGARRGRVRATHRPERGGPGDDPPGGSRGTHQRPADRVLAAHPGHREQPDPADLPGARHRHHRLRCARQGAARRASCDRQPGDVPRFQGENLEHNQALVAPLQQIAAARGITLAQLAIAWVAAQGEDVVPIVGARRTSQVESMLGARDIALSATELDRISALVPAGAAWGTRYPEAAMADLDSERSAG